MKVKYILFGIALAGLATSCDVTDKSPIDSFTDNSYWTKVSDLEYYANGLYDNLDKPAVDKDNVSDNCVITSPDTYLFNEYVIPATAKDAEWKWEIIRQCNFFMQRYQKVQGPENEINRYVAEVRFFRALEYYAKVKRFGDVPWYDKDLQTSDAEELYKPRDSRDFVLGKIIEDLEFAIQWLPDYGKAVSGRLTNDAARTQLARVCLYFGTYKKYHNQTGAPTSDELLNKAISLTDAIMASGNYSIVKGPDAGCGQKAFDGYPLYYSNQFIQEDLSSNKEAILVRIYEDGVLMHETGRQAGSTSGLSKDFVESFLCTDGKPISLSTLYQGDATLTDEFENRDPRMYQLIDNTRKPSLIINGVQQTNPFPNCEGNAAVTGYPCTKYHSPLLLQAEANKTTYDWFVYRYAEVLLINAEAKAEMGTCTQEVLDKTINQLRDRIEMIHLTTSPVADPKAIDYGYTVSPLIYEIRRERRIELVTEGFRLDDLKRWNAMKLLENPKTMLGIRITDAVRDMYKIANIVFGNNSGERPTGEYDGKTYLMQYVSRGLTPAGRQWTATDKRWFYPLPTDELILNTNLKQNAGWD